MCDESEVEERLRLVGACSRARGDVGRARGRQRCRDVRDDGQEPAQIKGKWVLTFANGGTYKVALNGQLLARGTYSATATTITLREPAGNGCGGSGTYAWKRSGKRLRFTRITESPKCAARAAVLAHTFSQR